MKRNIAIFITAIANIILLAHLVMPHHSASHQNDFCSISLHKLSSNTDKCPHTDNQSVSQNSSDKSNHDFTFEDCQLEQVHTRPDKGNSTLQALEIDVDTVVVFISKIFIDLIIPKSTTKEKILAKYISPIYHFSPTNIVGLRAPPF